MRKIIWLTAVIAAALLLSRLDKPARIGMVIINEDRIESFEQRLEISRCIKGEEGIFKEPVSVTLYTDNDSVMEYRELKARLESWGADVILRKETEQNIFDFRALGELDMYIWEGKRDDIFQAFLSENSLFYSTGFESDEYDRCISDGDFEMAEAMLYDNISIAGEYIFQ